MAIRWFSKPKPKDIWDEPIATPVGDIEAAHIIRDICRSAADSARSVGRMAADRGARNQQEDFQRYERAARAAMEIAMKIADDLLRDSAVRQIVDLCFEADDLRTARILFRAIQATSIREETLRDHPPLGH